MVKIRVAWMAGISGDPSKLVCAECDRTGDKEHTLFNSNPATLLFSGFFAKVSYILACRRLMKMFPREKDFFIEWW